MFPIIPFDYPVGFLDGVASTGICGAGLFIKMGSDTTLKGWLKFEVGSNTRAELVAL